MANDAPSGPRTGPGPGQGSRPNPFADAGWFPESFDPRNGEFGFVATDRDTLAQQNFLDRRWDRAGARRMRTGVAAAADALPRQKPPLNFIWHTGFCCSTLLAKAIDQKGRNLSLCEPWILIEITDAKRAGALGRPSLASVPQLAFGLLGRSFAPGERITLKPAPAASHLLRDAAAHTEGAMLFLYSDCKSFVASIAKLGEGGRKYVRTLLLAILGDGHLQSQWPGARLLALSDLELAAIVWHMQIAEFTRHWPAARAASLDCDAFLAAPAETLAKLDAHFSLGLGADHLRQVAEGPLFRRNAKTAAEGFDANTRREEHARVASELGDDLSRVVEQSYALCPATPRGAPLPNPLLSTDKIAST